MHRVTIKPPRFTKAQTATGGKLSPPAVKNAIPASGANPAQLDCPLVARLQITPFKGANDLALPTGLGDTRRRTHAIQLARLTT